MSENARRFMLLLLAVALPSALVALWGASAGKRLHQSEGAASKVAVASVTDDAYCTPQLKAIVRRVAGACGLVAGGSGGRGCQPMVAKKVASLSGNDFNAMFKPLAKRAHIVQFDLDKSELDAEAKQLVEKAWADQRGASFFFVVARASPEGDSAYNEGLSRDRAKAVLSHLEERFKDPDLDKQVGLLWLGEDFAQLDPQFCTWSRSHAGECTAKEINRSSFIAWIDCAI
ncbi:MAG: OmpA family protein [Deltaproteobacteria bacterium]|nr:OmpA family protein [Deltaproteobacteria bacterium]